MLIGDVACRPGERFFECDLDVAAQILPARRSGAALLLRPCSRLAEKHVEDVAEAFGEAEVSEAARRSGTIAGVPVTVVKLPLLRIGEDRIRFVDLLEAQ